MVIACIGTERNSTLNLDLSSFVLKQKQPFFAKNKDFSHIHLQHSVAGLQQSTFLLLGHNDSAMATLLFGDPLWKGSDATPGWKWFWVSWFSRSSVRPEGTMLCGTGLWKHLHFWDCLSLSGTFKILSPKNDLRPRGKGRKLAWQGAWHAWHENTMMRCGCCRICYRWRQADGVPEGIEPRPNCLWTTQPGEGE